MSEKVSAKEQAKTFQEMSYEDKLQALYTVRKFVTLNSVSKDTLKIMFDWLFDEMILVEELEDE